MACRPPPCSLAFLGVATLKETRYGGFVSTCAPKGSCRKTYDLAVDVMSWQGWRLARVRFTGPYGPVAGLAVCAADAPRVQYSLEILTAVQEVCEGAETGAFEIECRP